mgnify:CR=1 FL=1
MLNTQAVSPRLVPGLLQAMHTLQMSAILVGEPGIGKTQMVNQFARRLAETQGLETPVPVRRLILSQIDAVDIRGLTIPDREAGVTRYLPPEFLPDPKIEPHGILFLDEIDRCEPTIQSSAFTLLLEREVGKVKIPDGWLIVAAANGTEFSENTFEFDPALADRLVFYKIEPSVEDWLDWGAKTGEIVPDILAFIKRAPEYFSNGKQRASGDKLIGVSPRSWHRVSQALSIRMTADEQRATIMGIVGQEATVQLYHTLDQLDQETEVTTLMQTQEIKKIRKLVPATTAGLWRLAYGMTAMATTVERAEHAFVIINNLDASREHDPDLPVLECQTLAAEMLLEKVDRDLGRDALDKLVDTSAFATYDDTRATRLDAA